MSEYNSEENKELNSEKTVEAADSEYSTIFSSPVEHKPKKGAGRPKKRILTVIAATLAVAVLLGGAFAVKKLIPVKEDEDEGSASNSEITIFSVEPDDIASVHVTNTNGNFIFLASREQDESENTVTSWTLEGYSAEKISSSSISTLVSSVSTMGAIREISGRSPDECGLEDPLESIRIVLLDGSEKTVNVGSSSPDRLGNYCNVSSDETIYLIESAFFTDFAFEALDLANANTVGGIAITDEMADYVSDDALASFDEIHVTGKNYPEEMVIAKNEDTSEVSGFYAYVVTSPAEHYAENYDGILGAFSSGISSSGALSFEAQPSDLSKFGLDDPYLYAEIRVAGSTHSFKFSAPTDGYCAVVNSAADMIYKVSVDNIPFLEYTAESFYSKTVIMEYLASLSDFTLQTDVDSYSFSISYDEDADSDSQFTISYGETQITQSYFQNFYQDIIGIQYTDFKVTDESLNPDLVMTFTFLDGKTRRVALFKESATKYYCSVDGKILGRVSSTDYLKLLKDVRNVSQNQDIP